MKKLLIMVMAFSVLMLASITASAHDWHEHDNDNNWHRTHQNDNDEEQGMPFKWHQRQQSLREHHHLERINDREWGRKFPGLHAYRWHGQEFSHHGHRVNDAFLFFDENDELVSIGYMADGVFIHFREDHSSFENHDSFFVGWGRR
jgi:Ni/Co efflux regulator RcnB